MVGGLAFWLWGLGMCGFGIWDVDLGCGFGMWAFGKIYGKVCLRGGCKSLFRAGG